MTPLSSVLLALAITLPKAAPPDASRLASGYHVTAHGCVVADVQRPPPAGTMRRSLHFVASLGQTTSRQYEADVGYRIPLSDALYRAHRIHEAKLEWQKILADAPYGTSDSATALALQGRFQDALVRFATSPPRFNAVTFGDDGSAYNMQRGLNAAAQGDISAAKTFLEYSVECDGGFQIPHLALGIIAAMEHRFTAARHEWLAALEGWDPSTMPSITTAQYDAIRLLLKYS